MTQFLCSGDNFASYTTFYYGINENGAVQGIDAFTHNEYLYIFPNGILYAFFLDSQVAFVSQCNFTD